MWELIQADIVGYGPGARTVLLLSPSSLRVVDDGLREEIWSFGGSGESALLSATILFMSSAELKKVVKVWHG